jgi:hypothetical protein
LKAHLIPFGVYFDSDSRLAPVDKKTGLKISMFREDQINFDKSMAFSNEKIKQPLSWEELKTSGDGSDWAEYFVSHGISQVPILLTMLQLKYLEKQLRLYKAHLSLLLNKV